MSIAVTMDVVLDKNNIVCPSWSKGDVSFYFTNINNWICEYIAIILEVNDFRGGERISGNI